MVGPIVKRLKTAMKTKAIRSSNYGIIKTGKLKRYEWEVKR